MGLVSSGLGCAWLQKVVRQIMSNKTAPILNPEPHIMNCGSFGTEILVYSLTELSFQVNLPMFEMEVMNYIKSTFSTREVVEVVKKIQHKATLVTKTPFDSPFAEMKKLAPDLWEIVLAGNDYILGDLLNNIHNSGGSSNGGVKAIGMVAPREWVRCSALCSMSLFQLTPPALIEEVSPDLEMELRPGSSHEITDVVLLPRNKISYIIGSCGKRIERIREQSCCHITIPPIAPAKLMQLKGMSGSDYQQELILKGTDSQVSEAKSLIRRLLISY